jgi:hypothetical protein
MFDGNSKIQSYNRAVRFLYSFHDPKRYESALAICNQFEADEDFIFLKMIVYLQMLSSSTNTTKIKYM